MRAHTDTKSMATPSPSADLTGLLQRQCACGSHTTSGNECPECSKKKRALQRKRIIGAANDPLELEADRVADKVTSVGSHSVPGRVVPRIQRLTGQARAQMDQAPASVDKALTGHGTPLEPTLRKDMERVLGHDFSNVRVYNDTAAAESAHDLGATAYTVGNKVVFGTDRFQPKTDEGRRLISHELTHVAQQATGRAKPHVQRDLSTDIRTEAELPSGRRTPGKLGQLETRARRESDQAFQQLTGQLPLAPGTTGRATQVINHVAQQIGQMENARARGYQQAASAIVGQQSLNAPQASSFWLAFAGNTIWALSGLVPLLGPVVGVSRIAAAAGRQVVLRTNAIGRFLKAGGGAVASSVVGVAGAELSQFSGGIPAGSSLPRTLQAIQTEFTNVNSRVMSRYRTEAFALTLDFLSMLTSFIDPSNTTPITPDFLENLTKGALMETLFADLNTQGILDQSNFTIDTGKAQEVAKNDLLQAFVLRFGTVRDVAFQTSRDEIGDRLGATGTSAALTALGGESAFASRLRGNHALVVGNVNGVLADWGARNTLSIQKQNELSTGTALASGSHSVPFAIEKKSQFATQLDGRNYDPLTQGVRTIHALSRRGARWSASVLPSTGTASFSSSDYRSLNAGGRTIFGLQELTLEFAPSGTFRSGLSERSTIEPDSRQTGVFSFSGKPERVKVHVSRDVAF